MAILNNSNAISSGGYDINNSLRLRRSNNAYLSRTPAGAGNQQTWTYSAWVKRGLLGSIQDIWHANGSGTSENDYFAFDNDTLQFRIKNSNTVVCELITTQVFRDPSAWYHIVLAWDSTQATSSNRVKIYVNGTQITAFTTATYPAQNTNTNSYNSTVLHTIGTQWYSSTLSNYYDGYITEVNFVNAQALTPSSFGETDTTTGSWKPKAYTGTYGTNGFYLKFSDIATTSGSNAGLGKDFSGNANYWNTSGISVTAGTTYDAMIDSPTLTSATVANYCVLNPLVASTTATITNANLSSTGSTTTFANARATFTLSSEKWYWEHTITGTSTLDIGIGLCTEASQKSSASNIRQTGWYNVINGGSGDVGTSANGGSNVNISTTNWATNDIIMVAYDAATGYIWFGRNGTWYPPTTAGSAGNPAAGTNQTISAVSNLIPASWHYNTNAGTAVNFGQRPFSYTPPTGFKALNTYNLPDSTIKKGSSYMDATLWTGNGTSQSIVNASAFKPDFVWVKSRSNAFNNNLFNSTSGVNKFLVSDTTAAEASVSGTLTAFNSNGFSVGSDIGLNYNGGTYVGWQWQAGQGSTSSNTSGSITSTVSVSTTAGFSVVTYTGTGANATVGHGLGVAPKWVIVKGRTNVDNWPVYQASANASPATGHLLLNTSAAFTSTSSTWNNTAPTSTVFTIGTDTRINQNTITYVAYCWAEIAGFSKFGSYTGNGSADGPFVYTGFRPKYILFKQSSAAGEHWIVFDSTRTTYNIMGVYLHPSLSNAESTFDSNDFLSNGFKIRVNHPTLNTNGATYIYMAFAENPFKNANAR